MGKGVHSVWTSGECPEKPAGALPERRTPVTAGREAGGWAQGASVAMPSWENMAFAAARLRRTEGTVTPTGFW